jgi:hypothetical protein
LKAGKQCLALGGGAIALALSVASLFAATAVANASQHHRATHSRVSIRPWPHGLFGYVTSPAARRCGAHRRVVVFTERGRGRHPARDRRIGVARATRSHGLFRWVERTSKVGRFYAKAPRRGGCSGALSKSIRLAPSSGTGDTGDDAYPVCGPFVSEGTSSICHFTTLDARLPACGSFTKADDQCDAKLLVGPFPWWGGGATFVWHNHQNFVGWFAYEGGFSNDTAHLLGSMPGPGSDRYTIDEAFAESQLNPHDGDHFYTPDLPGQKAGKVGGPLSLNYFTDEHEPGLPYRVRIDGYLYLKR